MLDTSFLPTLSQPDIERAIQVSTMRNMELTGNPDSSLPLRPVAHVLEINS